MNGRRGFRILFVGDDEAFFFEVERVLDRMLPKPESVDWERTYPGARFKLSKKGADLCLLDETVGGQSSRTLYREWKDAHWPTPLLLLVPPSPDDGLSWAFEGAEDAIEREPLDPRTLARAMRNAISQTRSRQELRLALLEVKRRQKQLDEQDAVLRERENALFARSMISTDTDDLSARNAQLAMASRSKSEFLMTVSHELRTPLNAIIGFSEVLLGGQTGALPPAQQAFVEDIFGAGQTLLRIINDLLDLSRIEAGKLDLKLRSVEVGEVLEQTIHLLSHSARSKGVELLHREEGSVYAMADHDRLAQVVTNLISNAIKFTPAGGQIVARCTSSAGRAILSVRDNGIGIDPGDIDKLFQPFSQVDTGYSRDFTGTGLGLSICRQLVELMGGEIAVVSEKGAGAWFRVWLPSAESRTVRVSDIPGISSRFSAVLPADRTSRVEGGGAVLVIDDSEVNRRVLRAMLEAMGCQVTESASAEEGIEMATRLLPRAVLMDIQMPGLDGFAATKILKESELTRNIPVIAVTAHAMKEDAIRAKGAGCTAFVSKPIARAKLKAALDFAISQEPRSVR